MLYISFSGFLFLFPNIFHIRVVPENYKFLLGDKLEHLLDRSLTNRFSLGKKMPKDTARTISDVLNNRFRPSDFQSSLIEGARVMPGKIGSLQSAWPRLQEIYRTLQNTNIRPE